LTVQKEEVKDEEVYHLLRLCVTGYKSGPNIIKTCRLLGRNETVSRINNFKHQI
jgi:glutamyl/glutaminyl-tRNA synthetase